MVNTGPGAEVQHGLYGLNSIIAMFCHQFGSATFCCFDCTRITSAISAFKYLCSWMLDATFVIDSYMCEKYTLLKEITAIDSS